MELKPNKYYAKQMNGPVISATGAAVNAEFENAEAIQKYLHDLSIDTANETELENIGKLIGYVRPLVPDGFNSENILLLGGLPLETDQEVGLSDLLQGTGGQLSSIVGTDSNFMSLGVYRKFLKSMAVLKRYGITLQSVDKIAATVNKNYTIEFDENKDIQITYHDNIGYKNIWILTQLFYRITTAPQVLISSEGGEYDTEANTRKLSNIRR